jgi:3-carboxy-cis,cis-muconate cycloisomerase
MKPSSSHSDGPPGGLSEGLLAPLFGTAAVDEQVSDDALLRAMLDAERALAEAAADVGVAPRSAAEEIGRVCASGDVGVLDPRDAGNPVMPLVRALGERLPQDARPWLHYGATSQDILDTALMLCVTRALASFESPEDACADLVRAHRRTPMAARTLGQQAGPTTFGLKAAGWLSGLVEARVRLDLPVQLGGATGTLAAFGDVAVVERFAERLGLAVPVLPWHTNRQPVLETAAALGRLVVALGKIALDVTLLAQTEVGEVSERTGGGSSALPHKQNPVDSILVTAAARRMPGPLATLYAAGLHEHERATGSWHAEWEPLRELVRLAGSASARTTQMLAGLVVHPHRMRANLDLTGGLVMSEAVADRLAPALGRTAAHDLVARLARTDSFRAALLADPDVRKVLETEQDVDDVLDPTSRPGAVDALIDRALEAYER